MKIITGFLITLILFFWYIDINSYHEQKKYIKTNDLTWEEAKIKIKYPNPNYKYYWKEERFVFLTKTIIPFKYKETIIGKKRGYYNEEII